MKGESNGTTPYWDDSIIRDKMSKTHPWHSVKQNVHHHNTECNVGNNIEKENLRRGDGGKPLCKECERLDKEGK